jgi:hypothetical protein
MAAVARLHRVSRAAVHETAKRWAWASRAAAWDEHQSLQACQAPQRLQQAAAAAPLTHLVSDDARDAERQFMVMLEQYRAAVEALSRDQLQTARAMTAVSRRSVARLLEDGRTLSSKDISAFVNSATHLAAAAQASWGRAIGVDALLDRLESSLAAVDAAVVEPIQEAG